MSGRTLTFVFVAYSCIWIAFGDIYFHNPRGSNNRLDGTRRNVRNNKRMFDSENNNRGGYNVGPSLEYYAGSILPIEWTNQHSCNTSNNNCEITIQYMCGDSVRDGNVTTTIPTKQSNCENGNCQTDETFGMHETFDEYTSCFLRERNNGLFIADQELNGRTARFTRQANNGQRYGYECPEERDYYPYWHPTGWKDIVIMTNDVSRCPYYQRESQNVKSRFACVPPADYYTSGKRRRNPLPISKEACEEFRWPPAPARIVKGYGVWKEFPAHNIPEPDCRQSMGSRDNHNGNGLGRTDPNSYDWIIPELEEKKCVLRIRYNISTNDYNSWETFSDANGSPNTGVDIASLVGLSDENEAINRGYIFQNNPVVNIFPDHPEFQLRLAINTAQLGRTFQDRSHTFSITPRPADLQKAIIHNLNVRGKRGNIVQNYPAVEYDFVPNTLEISSGHYVHIQWTGADTNPKNNAGQGTAGQDRSNMLLLHEQNYDEGTPGAAVPLGQKHGHWGNSYPTHLDNARLIDLPRVDLEKLATASTGPYFNLGLRRVSLPGTYYYFSTANNAFTNRSQKGKIVVKREVSSSLPAGSLSPARMDSYDDRQFLVEEEGVLRR